jgi:hypothetical protein
MFGEYAAYGMAVWYLYLFILAYRVTGKAVILWINHYGEANLEIWVMAFAYFAMVYSLGFRVYESWKIRKKIENTIKDVG